LFEKQHSILLNHYAKAVWLLNLLKNKSNELYISNHSVPRCKHFPPRLWKPIS